LEHLQSAAEAGLRLGLGAAEERFDRFIDYSISKKVTVFCSGSPAAGEGGCSLQLGSGRTRFQYGSTKHKNVVFILIDTIDLSLHRFFRVIIDLSIQNKNRIE
jgi:hypothetical protein